MKDIQSRSDVELLVNKFYNRVLTDEVIGHIFSEHMEIPLKEHLPIMYNFWSSVLLGEASYRGNVMLSHIKLNEKVRLENNHFDSWIRLWNNTIDIHFEGPKAEEAKKRAQLMKELMIFKIDQSSKNNFIQ